MLTSWQEHQNRVIRSRLDSYIATLLSSAPYSGEWTTAKMQIENELAILASEPDRDELIKEIQAILSTVE